MSDQTESDTNRSAESTEESEARTRRLVIVKRHQFATFSALARAFAGEPDVRLVWDRRWGDRRADRPAATAGERRRSERRRQDSTWVGSAYMVVTMRPSTAAEDGGGADTLAERDPHQP